MVSEKEQKIQEALDAFERGEFPSLRKVSTAYQIDRKTLTRRLRGGITRQEAREGQQLLSSTQENLLARWIIDLDLAGAPPSFAQVREFAGLISQASGGTSSIGVNWIQRFLIRHPELKSKVGRKIEYLRVENTSPEALQAFFDYFWAVMTHHHIDIANIWNCDEHGLGMGVCTNQRVIGSTQKSRSYIKTPENRDWVTIIEACSIDGRSTDPLILFKGKDLQSTWFPPNTPLNWHFRCTENAFTTNAVSLAWLQEIFLPQTFNNGAVRLLLCDNHGSHTTVSFMYQCYMANVQLVYMPSHSSHILQPLDVGVFSSLKRNYRKEIADLLRFVEITPVQRAQFIKYYSKARAKTLIPRYITTGWSGAGIYPWNPEIVLRSSQVINILVQPPLPPQTPPSRKRQLPSEVVYTTPSNGRHFQAQALSVIRDLPNQREARLVIQKTAKAIDQLVVQASRQSLQIDSLSVVLQDQKPTKRTKVAIDSNKTFASIVEIREAQERVTERQEMWNRVDRVQQAKKVSEQLQKTEFNSLCIEWHVNDVGGVDN